MKDSDLDRLAELEAKATKGPWVHIVGYGIGAKASVSLGFNPLDNDGKPNDDQLLTMELRNNSVELLRLARRGLEAERGDERRDYANRLADKLPPLEIVWSDEVRERWFKCAERITSIGLGLAVKGGGGNG